MDNLNPHLLVDLALVVTPMEGPLIWEVRLNLTKHKAHSCDRSSGEVTALVGEVHLSLLSGTCPQPKFQSTLGRIVV